MTQARLSIALVERVLGWRVGEGRWITGPDRRWLSLPSFAPTDRIQDALHLLERANADFVIASRRGAVVAEVVIAGQTARARGTGLALVLCTALAKALGVGSEDTA